MLLLILGILLCCWGWYVGIKSSAANRDPARKRFGFMVFIIGMGTVFYNAVSVMWAW